MQRRIAMLEQLPLLGVHSRCLSRRDTEEAMIEELGTIQKATVPHTAQDLGRTAEQVKPGLLHIPP